MRDEIWRDIPEYENYEVSNLARVRNKTRGNYLPGSRVKGTPFLRVALWKEGVPRFTVIHRLVAMAFLPNYDESRRVTIIDPDSPPVPENLSISMQGARQSEYAWGDCSEERKVGNWW